MKTFRIHTLMLLALALLSGIALADPPTRVGRIAYLQGEVEVRATYEDEPMAAMENWPLTSHNVIATGPGARAELRVGSTALRLDGDSELEIAELDDQHFRLRLLQGSLNARVKNPDLVQDFELNTAQGQLTLEAPSQIHVDAGRSPGTTVASVLSGAARFDNGQSLLALVTGQRAVAAHGGMQLAAAVRDEFDFWSLARDQRDDQAVSARYVSPEVTGYEALDQYGSWDMTEDYGAVWYPQGVAADWAPYRNGRWAWIEPWGWTWIDNAPWGYAPFHYGRWAWYRERWCWVPGRVVARPVWAPALVGWVGGQHWNARFTAGNAPAVGWFPLAPHEPFRPSYAASPAYLRQLNLAQDLRNRRHPVDLTPQAVFRNRIQHNAVTVIPHERFRHGRTVVVANAPPLIGAPQQLAEAPLAAVAPAARPAPVPGIPRSMREERRPLPAPHEWTPQSTPPTGAMPAPPRVRPAERNAPAAIAPDPPVQHRERAPLRIETPPRTPGNAPAAPHPGGMPPEHGRRADPAMPAPVPLRPLHEAAPHEQRAPARSEIRQQPMPEQRQAPGHIERRPAPAGLAPAAPRGEARAEAHPPPRQREAGNPNRSMQQGAGNR